MKNKSYGPDLGKLGQVYVGYCTVALTLSALLIFEAGSQIIFSQ